MRFTQITRLTASVPPFRIAVFTGMALLFGACGGGGDSTTEPTPPGPVPVASVSVALTGSSLTVGQSATASAILRSTAGAELTGRSISWSSSNASVATVSGSGQVTAVAAGTADIVAISEGKSGSASVIVAPAPVATVSVTLSAASLTIGQTANATATLRSAAGADLTGRTVTWTSSNAAIATVSAAGAVSAVAPGSTNITATSEGMTGSATLTVTLVPVASITVALSAASVSVGQTATAAATLRSAAGAVLTGRNVTWASTNNAVATVSAVGVVTAVTSGTTTISATSEGQSGTAALTVTPAAVASVVLSTDSSDVPLRTSLQLTATTRDANGGTLTGRTVTWSVAPAGIATITASGLARMLQPGTVTVTATSEGRTATARLRATVANLTAMVDSIRDARGMPAMGVAIVSREGLIGIGVAGTRRVNGNIPVTVSDKWHLGSNTKALTGFLAGMAVQAGVVTWERTVEQAFPDLASVIRAEYRDVTLRELLSHVGGIINSTTGVTSSTDLPAARTAWATYTVQQAPVNARGVYYYSNNAFGMAGAVIERAWGGTYEQLMQSRIFGPLGLQNVGWGPTTVAGASDQPQGHRWQGNGWVTCEGCDNPPGLSSAGTLHMPLASWARMMQEVLLADQGRSALLTQANARYLTINHVPAGGGNTYGIGWGIGGAVGNRMVAHDGSNTNNHSRAAVYLDAGVAFLITINAADIDGGRTPATLNAMQIRLDSYWQTGR